MRTRSAAQPVCCDSVFQEHHSAALGMRIAPLCIGAFRFIILLRNER